MTGDEIQRVINYLQGTCQSLDEAMSALDMNEDDITNENYDEIDNQIFRCETCSWWVESHEQDEEGNCTECAEG